MKLNESPTRTRHASSSSRYEETIRELKKEVQEERKARIKAEKRVEKLEDEIAELRAEFKRYREQRRETTDFLQNEIRKLELENKQLKTTLEAAMTTLIWFQGRMFGTDKSEKGVPEDKEPQESSKDDRKKKKKKKGQQKGSKGHGRTDNSQLPVGESQRLEIPGCSCDVCGKAYLELPEGDTSRIYEIIVQCYQDLFERQRYVSQCDCKGKKLVTAPPPPTLYRRTNIGNTLWIHILIWRYLGGVPQSKILRNLALQELKLAAGTVTGGLKKVDPHLNSLYEGIVNFCRGQDFLHADETSWRVFEQGKKQNWFWVFGNEKVAAYILDPSRSQKVPAEFLAGSTLTLLTDRYSAYKALSGAIRKAYCWVHVRRDFLNIFKGNKRLKKWARNWLKRFGKLFSANHKREKLWRDKMNFGVEWNRAQTAVELIIKDIHETAEQELRIEKLHPKQKKVLRSLKRHWSGLTVFLEDPRIPLSNNHAERLLRNIVVSRKNSYGSQATWAGNLAAKVFSIFQTWLLNGLDPQKLLLDFFNQCAESRVAGKDPPDPKAFLPWTMSEERKQLFSIPKSIKKPA